MDSVALILSLLALFIATLSLLSDVIKDFEAIARAEYRSILLFFAGIGVVFIAIVELSLSIFNMATSNLPAAWSTLTTVLLLIVIPIAAIPFGAYLIWSSFRPYRDSQ